MAQIAAETKLADARSGMTALELVVAGSLAALLMVAMMGLLGRLSKRHQELTQDDHELAWSEAIAARFQEDFENAHTIFIHRRVVIFDGTLLCKEPFGIRLHRNARVIYRLALLDNKWVLIREQVSIEKDDQERMQVNIVATGAQEFEFAYFDPKIEQWRIESFTADGYKRIDVKQSMRLRVWSDREHRDQPLLETVLVKTGAPS